MRLPDGLDDENALRAHLESIDLTSLANYIEQLDTDEQLRVLHLLRDSPPSAEEINQILASLYQQPVTDPDDEGG